MDTVRIPIAGGLHVAVHHQAPGPDVRRGRGRAVLYIHGATFPSSLAMFWRFGDVSWADALTRAGFHVFGLDFLGFGASDRYAEPFAAGPDHIPGRALEVQEQIAAAVHHVRERVGVERIDLIAHSWGTMPAALFASAHPKLVERLVLFAPITARGGEETAASIGPWNIVTAGDQWTRFSGYVPAGEPLLMSREWFDPWVAAYLASDPLSATRSPPGVKVPAGPVRDIHAAAGGKLPYAPQEVTVPTLVVRGEWDSWPTDADAQWLMNGLTNAPVKRDVKLPRGTHVMHLESNRLALFAAVEKFIE